MAYNNRDLIPSLDAQPGGDGSQRTLWGAAPRVFGRARRRWQREQIYPIAEVDGVALRNPSGGELVPDLRASGDELAPALPPVGI